MIDKELNEFINNAEIFYEKMDKNSKIMNLTIDSNPGNITLAFSVKREKKQNPP